MRNLKNQNDALIEALTMLRVVERGGSYDSAEWFARMIKLEKFLDGDSIEILNTHTCFDLGESKSRIKSR